jgi:hypothetical protein
MLYANPGSAGAKVTFKTHQGIAFDPDATDGLIGSPWRLTFGGFQSCNNCRSTNGRMPPARK